MPRFVQLFAARRQALLRVVVGLILVVLILPPIAAIILTALHVDGRLRSTHFTLRNLRNAVDNVALTTIRDTLIFIVGSAALAVILGGTTAWITEKTNAPLRRVALAAALICLAVPSIVQNVGWTLLMGPNNGALTTWWRDIFGNGVPFFPLYSMAGLILVQGLLMFPVAYLVLMPAFGSANQYLDEAAAMSGARPSRVAFRVTLPLARPSLLAALLLCVILALETFEAPAFIGTPAGITVFSTAIATDINSAFPDYGLASAYSLFTMVLAIVIITLYQRATVATHKYAVVTGKGFRPVRIDLGRFRWLGGAFVSLVSLVVVAPLLVLIWSAFLSSYQAPSIFAVKKLQLGNFRQLLGGTYQVVDLVKHTLIFGVLTSVIVMILSLMVAWLSVGSKRFKYLDQLGTLPLVIPGVVLSLALFQVTLFLRVDVSWIFVVLAFVIVHMPYGLRFSFAGLASIHSELDEAASTSGAGVSRRFGRIIVPLMRPMLLAGGIFVLVAVVRNLSAVLFLSRDNTAVISYQMWILWGQGDLGVVSALATLVIAAVLVVGALAVRLLGPRRRSFL
jgi:iron(III) transport system permease protein